jgi:hypothetical protein
LKQKQSPKFYFDLSLFIEEILNQKKLQKTNRIQFQGKTFQDLNPNQKKIKSEKTPKIRGSFFVHLPEKRIHNSTRNYTSIPGNSPLPESSKNINSLLKKKEFKKIDYFQDLKKKELFKRYSISFASCFPHFIFYELYSQYKSEESFSEKNLMTKRFEKFFQKENKFHIKIEDINVMEKFKLDPFETIEIAYELVIILILTLKGLPNIDKRDSIL